MQDFHRPGAGGIELIPVHDANEGAFTIHLPRGWENRAVTVRPDGVPRSLISSRRPDGAVSLFSGDLRLQTFQEPGTGVFAGVPSGKPEQPYTAADPFFRQYLEQVYGRVFGFKITGTDACPVLEELVRGESQRLGLQPRLTTVRLAFEYFDLESYMPSRGLLFGTTISFGELWCPEAGGVLTTVWEDPATFEGLYFQVARSRQENPQWRQRQNQAHQQRTAQIARDHQNTMQQLQQSHQVRMDTLHAASDTQFESWRATQAAGDAAHRRFLDALNGQTSAAPGGGSVGSDWNHRRFLNTITEKETVVGEDGSQYEVETGHQRYYRHKYDNTYLGTDNYTERDDLRSRFGVNPDDYEEVRIRR
jgi:hypothetical protein